MTKKFMPQTIQCFDDFELSPSLKASTFPIIDLELCTVLLQNDARFPWVILVPRMVGLNEFYDLPRDKQHLLMDEIAYVSKSLQSYTKADKINIAAFGNITPQLHVHIIARFITDPFWPNSVMGMDGKIEYTETEKNTVIKGLL